MTRLLFIGIVATALLTPAMGDDPSSTGLKTGDSVGVFYVTKVAGADDDGVKAGDELCYRCRYGSRPMVMVFSRETGGKLPELVKSIDMAVANGGDSQLRGLVTFLGDDAAKVKQEAAKFASKASAKHIPLTIAKETKAGPANYKLDASPVTVIVAIDSQVVSRHGFKADAIDIKRVMNEVKQMLRIDAAKNDPRSG